MVESSEVSTRPETKSRPQWLRALGQASPPLTISIRGEVHRLKEIFKHDSWAATALYENDMGTRRIVKLHRQSPLFGLPMKWVGRITAGNERAILERLKGLPGIPSLSGPIEIDGTQVPNGVARDFVAGHPLRSKETLADDFFPELLRLLDGMHGRKVAYVDLHKRENIIVGESGLPYLIDFQISLSWPRWMPAGPLFRIFTRSDDYHLMKHWARCRPDQCGIDSETLQKSLPWWIRAHRLVARPIRELRRRLLVRIGVRSGKGRVETEVFAEHALRDINPSRNRAA